MGKRRALPRRQLQPADIQLIDETIQGGGGGMDALRALNKAREKRGVAPVTKSSVHRYIRGRTHKRCVVETRGRKRVLTKTDERRLDQVRTRLVKKASNQYRVTYSDIVSAAGLDHVSQRVCQEALRNQGVRFRNPRNKILLAAEDAKHRLAVCLVLSPSRQRGDRGDRSRRSFNAPPDVRTLLRPTFSPCRVAAPRSILRSCDHSDRSVGGASSSARGKEWSKRPPAFWRESVHAYVDNKNFVMPLTPKQREKFRQTMVTGHLRKASEGTERGFTKPRQQHAFLGIPSVCVTAAVAKDRVILWHVHESPWNGQTAADTYAGPMLTALKRTWGHRKPPPQRSPAEAAVRSGSRVHVRSLSMAAR